MGFWGFGEVNKKTHIHTEETAHSMHTSKLSSHSPPVTPV